MDVGDGVLVRVAGVGAARARRAAEALIDAGAPALLSLGFAAALAPSLRCGCLLLPARVEQQDGTRRSPDPDWRGRWLATAAGQPLSEAALAETHAVLSTVTQKRRMAARHDAVAADMESGAVLAVADEMGVRGMVVRVVLDELGVRLPRAATVALRDDGSVAWAALARAVGRAPQEASGLLALALAQRRARRALGRLLARAGPTLLVETADENRRASGHNPRP